MRNKKEERKQKKIMANKKTPVEEWVENYLKEHPIKNKNMNTTKKQTTREKIHQQWWEEKQKKDKKGRKSYSHKTPLADLPHDTANDFLNEWRNEQSEKQKSRDMQIIYDFIDLIKRTEY